MEIDKYSKKYTHYYNEEVPSPLESIFRKNNIRNIVDLGAGDGAILFALLRKGYLDKLEKVIAVDISKQRIDNVRKISEKIVCIVSDVCKLEMLDDFSLDLVISNQVIEHLQDENGLIKEAYRILAKDGLFYLSTVFKEWYGWYFYRCNGRWTLDPTHLREYKDEQQFLDILKKFNFEILENKKSLHWFPVTDFIFKRIGLGRNVYNNKFTKVLRNIKIPILGYYNWELVSKKI